MRIVRIFLSFLVFLASLCAAGLSYFFFAKEATTVYNLPPVGKIPLDVGFAVAAAVILVLAYMLFPPRRVKGGPGSKPEKSPKFSKAQAIAELKKKASDMKMEPESAQHEDEEQVDEEPEGSHDVSTYDRLEDPEAMARLVVIDQGEMSHEVVTDLFKEFYPELVKIVDKIKPDDQRTLDTLGKHIISIGRNMLKMTDKELSDNQFSIFQERNFKAEQEEVLRLYQPSDVSLLSDEQRSYMGIVVDKRSWESVQRVVRGQRTDWISISLSNAKQYL